MTGLKSLVIATAAVAIGGASVLGGLATASNGAGAPERASAPTASTSSTVAERATAPNGDPTRPGEPGAERADGPSAPVRDRLTGSTPGDRADGPADELGHVDTAGLVPAGLNLAAFPGAVAAHASHTPTGTGGGSLSAGPGCQYQCISSGVAYPRGFGAELVVDTKVPADLFMTVITDDDGDGETEFLEAEYSPGKVNHHSWGLDQLDPGQTYYVMVTATDEHDDTSYAWGEFTTLSTRTVEVSISEVDISGGPGNVVQTDTFLRLDDDDHAAYDLGDWAEFGAVDSTVDVDLLVARTWEANVCEPFWPSLMVIPQGDSDDSCVSWNTASADDVFLDVTHPTTSSWSSVSFTRSLATPQGGPSLPAGYGDPRYFHAAALATFHVTYSE